MALETENIKNINDMVAVPSVKSVKKSFLFFLQNEVLRVSVSPTNLSSTYSLILLFPV